MYLYVTEITDGDEEVNVFGPFRSEENAESWGKEEIGVRSGSTFKVIPLLDPHYINDAFV